MEIFPGYCIDTSALIDLWRRHYAPDVFESLWKNIQNLVYQRKLIAPREVLGELKAIDDELAKWAAKHNKMFIKLDETQKQQAFHILDKFPKLIDHSKSIPDADPFVISLAISRGWTVLTSEQPENLVLNPNARPKIPNACQHFNVKCIYKLLEFFREQGWKI